MHHLPLIRRLLLCLPLALSCGSDDSHDDTIDPSLPQGSAGSGNSTPGATAASGDTWDGFAQGFFASYCVSCHNDDNAGVAARDLHLRSVVDAEADEIACGLSKSKADWSARGCADFPPERQFPAGSGLKPSDAERDRLLAWIDAGRP